MSKKLNAADFIELKLRFDQQLSNGQRAEIRRARDPEELMMIPAAWKLGVPVTSKWAQVIMFLPLAPHQEGKRLGSELFAGKINETRLFQVLRSSSPRDLEYLRRLIRQVKPRLDWGQTGMMLFFWNEMSKRRLVEDYYMRSLKKGN